MPGEKDALNLCILSLEASEASRLEAGPETFPVQTE